LLFGGRGKSWFISPGLKYLCSFFGCTLSTLCFWYIWSPPRGPTSLPFLVGPPPTFFPPQHSVRTFLGTSLLPSHVPCFVVPGVCFSPDGFLYFFFFSFFFSACPPPLAGCPGLFVFVATSLYLFPPPVCDFHTSHLFFFVSKNPFFFPFFTKITLFVFSDVTFLFFSHHFFWVLFLFFFSRFFSFPTFLCFSLVFCWKFFPQSWLVFVENPC